MKQSQESSIVLSFVSLLGVWLKDCRNLFAPFWSRQLFGKWQCNYKYYCLFIIKLIIRRVARIWKRGGGGAILKEWEKCNRPWPEFSLFLNKFHTVCPKIETKFLGKLGNSNVFSPKIRWSPKKKKGLHRNLVRFFCQIRKFKRLRGGCFPKGGSIFNFLQKIGLKSTKNVRFCILHKPMGRGSSPPAPPPPWLR